MMMNKIERLVVVCSRVDMTDLVSWAYVFWLSCHLDVIECLHRLFGV